MISTPEHDQEKRREVDKWIQLGADSAERDIDKQKIQPSKSQLRRYLMDLYDREHDYIQQRERCITAWMAGYYGSWEVTVREHQRTVRRKFEQETRAQHGPVRVRKFNTDDKKASA